MKPRDTTSTWLLDHLRDLARGVRIAELPVVLRDRLVPPRQHELVAERQVVVAPPEREADAQAAVGQGDEHVGVRAPRDVREAGLEFGERQVLEHLERADRVEHQAGWQNLVELGDVGDVVDAARGVDVERLDLDAGRPQVIAEHARNPGRSREPSSGGPRAPRAAGASTTSSARGRRSARSRSAPGPPGLRASDGTLTRSVVSSDWCHRVPA